MQSGLQDQITFPQNISVPIKHDSPPNVAIVVGPMSMVVPKNEQKEERKKEKKDGEKDYEREDQISELKKINLVDLLPNHIQSGISVPIKRDTPPKPDEDKNEEKGDKGKEEENREKERKEEYDASSSSDTSTLSNHIQTKPHKDENEGKSDKGKEEEKREKERKEEYDSSSSSSSGTSTPFEPNYDSDIFLGV